ncbi:type IV pilin protein [Caldichromatium japonicum]|uniref:Type IV pilin protein n=1 Tax=Caldichromatium japonicum TaxID=2699430 RepID=A0A6G7VAD3_9GAMM|nr:type IV pilin protein [Caldichromatium japonicum]QIK36826.1 type IV pilin protein [Caldichromatium japonicum]
MKTGGFTLIEIMIVVVVVGILAAIAYPSYQMQVAQSRRSTAQACLLELSQFMERYYTTNMSYANATLPNTQCQSDLTGHYSFQFSGTPNATSYTLQAVAQGVQATKDAGCTPLAVTHTGSRTPANCWKK